MAKHPVTFFIRLRTYTYLELESLRLVNGETNEKLLMLQKRHGEYLISRIPMEANGAEWIQANEQEILEFEHISHDRTICLDLNLGNEDNNEEIYSYDDNGAKVPRMINA
jgi:hypothetical protein